MSLKSLTVLVLLLLSAGAAHAQRHTADLEIIVYRGAVGAHFSRYDGQTKVGFDVYEIPIRIPTGGSRFTKLASRDDSRSGADRRITPGRPWILKNFQFSGNGVYILDLADWDNRPDVYVKLVIDGDTRFEGRGTGDDFDDWRHKHYGPRTRKTDDREIAIDLN